MCRGCASSLPVCALMVVVMSATTEAQDVRAGGSLYEAMIPGGVRAAAVAVGDPIAPDRSQFLLELVRRFHHIPTRGLDDVRLDQLRSLIGRLEDPRAQASTGARETVPLPLPPHVWIDAVFAGRATPDTLVSSILRSRDASLLYAGLLSLDEATREWLAGKPQVVQQLASGRAAAFLVAAPALRVKDGQVQLPGEGAANPIWQELLGQPQTPEECITRILEQRNGRLAYFVGALAQLTPPQVAFALNLGASAAEDRVAAARRVYAAFEEVADRWRLDQYPFWRPPLDPALLLSELRVDDTGRPFIPGDRLFWEKVFDDSPRGQGTRGHRADARETADEVVTFDWLCERVFDGPPIEQRRRYNIVLFASRILGRGATEREQPAVEAVRAAGEYPALIGALERAGLTDVEAYAAAARRATRLGAIRNETHEVRALMQYQGALASMARAAIRGHLAPELVSRLVRSLADVPPNKDGDYQGGLVRWLDAHVTGSENTGGSFEDRMVRWLSGSSPENPSVVEWEGTRYRVDPQFAEATRLTRLLGHDPPPYVSSARTLAGIAENLDRGPTMQGVRSAADQFAGVRAGIEDLLAKRDADRLRDIDRSLQHAARGADPRRAVRLSTKLRDLADSFLARGLLELTYATALGQPGTAAISVSEAAGRHDFGPINRNDRAAWQFPEPGAWTDREWHVTGSLLGLDVRLAAFSLMRVSSRPPRHKPTLNQVDRRVFIEAVGLVQPATLSEAGRDELVAALRRGRARLAMVQSASEVPVLAREIRLSPARRALLAWAVSHEPDRVPAFLSLTELLWLGIGADAKGGFDAWGAPGEPRVGCLCLRLVDRRPWEMFAGRSNTGILASGFPDLNLRLAELLADMHMPAALLPAVLAPATLDFIENVTSRDDDDRRGLVEYVRGLSRERTEEYLALLTTDGPLVAVGNATATASHVRNPQ